MDERLKAELLLAGVYADARAWKRFLALGVPYAALWGDWGIKPEDKILTEKTLALLREREKNSWAEREYEACVKSSVRLVEYGAEDYPAALGDLKSPPLLLYCRGDTGCLASLGIGVVGTRRASAYGRMTAERIGGVAARAHAVLISGGAEGIDGSAHRGAVAAGGASAAVFGNGVDVVFPEAHRRLFDEILENGVLISEFPLGTRGTMWHFPRRNRIIAALSRHLVVVEAPLKSGAMITAGYALDLKRKLWAVPGRINEDCARGTNKLIYEGARPLIDVSLLFGSLGRPPSSAEDRGKRAPRACDFPPCEAAVLSLLWQRGGRTVDNIADEVKMSAADIFKTIAILSAKGAVYASGPGRYSAKI